MSSYAAAPASSQPRFNRRSAAALAGLALSLAAAALAWRLSPAGADLAPLGLGAVTLAASLALAATLREGELALATRGFGGVAILLFGAIVSGQPGEQLEPIFGLASLGLLGGVVYRLIATSGRRFGPIKPGWMAFAGALFAALAAFNLYYIWVSRDLEIADFMFYRVASIAVAGLLDSGRWPALAVQVAASMKADYSWAPALAPGLALALGAPLSRAVYQAAIMVCYAAPALVALGWLAREIAVRAGLERGAGRSRVILALAIAAVFAAYPTGVVVAAKGMPDIGGLALYVFALRLADRLARALLLPAGHEAIVRPMVRRLALALAITLFTMFLFRRWYAFAAVGVAATLALDLAFAVARRRGAFRWADAVHAGAIGALMGLALVSPVLVDWLPDPAAHDYAALYAAYRKPLGEFLKLVGDWWGWGLLTLACIGALFLAASSAQERLLRLTIGAAAIAAAMFLRVQTPYVHHAYLIAPAVTAALAAPILMMFAHARPLGLAALAGLAALTLTPVAAMAPRGLFPSAGRPHSPRTDLAELARLKGWVDANASASHKVCGLGSSYTFSGQLIDELWQLKGDRSPLYGDPKLRQSVAMSDVDTVEGPPAFAIKDCAVMIVGDPVQTHLNPAYQQTVIVPSREMLSGIGIGAHYRRTGEAFHLEKGVLAIVYEQTSPLDDADMVALADRWRAARAVEGQGMRGSLEP